MPIQDWLEREKIKTYREMVPFKIVEVKEPPCKNCSYWSPRVLTDKHGCFGGFRFCIANQMFSDFSCFTERKI